MNYRSHLAIAFGMSEEEYSNLHLAQKGLCAICGMPETDLQRKSGRPRRLAVDHHHGTKRIRALLCGKCNKGIGLFLESPALLRAAAAYLERHGVQAGTSG